LRGCCTHVYVCMYAYETYGEDVCCVHMYIHTYICMTYCAHNGTCVLSLSFAPLTPIHISPSLSFDAPHLFLAACCFQTFSNENKAVRVRVLIIFHFPFLFGRTLKQKRADGRKNEEGNVKGISEKRGKMLNEKKLKMETNER